MTDNTIPPNEFTRVLRELQEEPENETGSERLLAAIYDELRSQAGRLMRRERVEHTLQPTALVHEAYLKLVDQPVASWRDRAHFIGIATRAMRQVLVDHARTKAAAKRGGGWQRVTLADEVGLGSGPELELIVLDDALTQLAELDPRAARVAELRAIGGLSVKETAHVLDVSPRTVDNDWAVARMWLARALASGETIAPDAGDDPPPGD